MILVGKLLIFLGRLDVSMQDRDRAGWALSSLHHSIRRTVLPTFAGWQLVMFLATFLGPGANSWPLAVAFLVVGAYCLIAGRRSVPLWIVPLGMATTGAIAYILGGDLGSVLVFAACWQTNFATGVAALTIFSRRVFVAVFAGAFSTSLAILTFAPQLGYEFAGVVFVTQLFIVVAVRTGLRPLMNLAIGVDADEAELVEAGRRAEVNHRMSVQLAEQGRALHDSAINTLGAIANGGYGVANRSEVRRQCARDLEVLQKLEDHRSNDAESSLEQIFVQPGMTVKRTGLRDSELRQLQETLDTSVISAVSACLREAVTNARKHSGTDTVTIGFESDDYHLTITVRDDGVGFDMDNVSGYGIENSILVRAKSFGFAADIRSGATLGTEVVLQVPLKAVSLDPLESEVPLEDIEHSVARLKRGAGTLWCLGVSAVGLALSLVANRDSQTVLFLMVSVMGAVCFVAWRTRDVDLNRWQLSGLAVSAYAVFFLSAMATDFGTKEAVHWQALAATGPFVLFLSRGANFAQSIMAGSAWAAFVVVIVIHQVLSSWNAAVIVSIAGIIGIGFCYFWSLFQRTIVNLGRASAEAQRATEAAHTAEVAEQAAQGVYRRWLESGLDTTMQLLGEIASGSRQPDTESTRQACAEEERYLRQLILVSPEIVHLGSAMLPTLAHARERKIHYRMRLGELDVPNDSAARLFASTVHHALDATPADGQLSVSVFPAAGGIVLTLVGDRLDLETDAYLRIGVQNLEHTHRRLKTGELFQLTLPVDSRANAPNEGGVPM